MYDVLCWRVRNSFVRIRLMSVRFCTILSDLTLYVNSILFYVKLRELYELCVSVDYVSPMKSQ